jgi:peptidoglycan/xylan/chitin deacetylase (PgdA/CDA1 family)
MSKENEITRREFLKLAGFFLPGLYLKKDFSEGLKAPCVYFTRGDLKSNKVAITVDDGWEPRKVEKMLKVSGENKIPISAFPVGKVISASPELWRNALISGVELYNHTLDHRNLGDEQVGVKKQITGWEECYHKLGLGDFKNKVLRLPRNNGAETRVFNIAYALGYKGIAGWSVGSRGYSSLYSREDVMGEILPEIAGGSIILLHFVDTDIQVLPYIGEELSKKGLEAVSLSKLPGTPIYKIPRILKNHPCNMR